MFPILEKETCLICFYTIKCYILKKVRQITRDRKVVSNQSQKKNKTIKKDSRLPKMQKPMKGKRKHPDFGTSKVEQEFAREVLDKLGVRYIWQFEAKEIKRFFDFYCIDSQVLIEFDGDYYHSYGLVREQMNPMQKHSQRVDKEKDAWAALHGIPLIRIWEHDYRNNKAGVIKMLKERIYLSLEKQNKKKEKNKRHINKLNNKN